ncbi:MAG: ATP-binding protein [Thermoanaerobaculales bacterium]|jgi:two-component system sensor histidine kinase ChvG|nr:ATP-binding protein [Thermoanaerobaculales bacterium]
MRWLSRISVRLLAFNVLVVFLPMAGVLFLDTYERHLLAAQERTMAQEGRLLAASIEATGRFQAPDAEKILIQLGQRHLARLRVIDRQGELLADSSVLGPRREESESTEPETATTEDPLLYRIGSLPFRALRRAAEPPDDVIVDWELSSFLDASEVRDALDGRYGASTRITPGSQRSVTLYIAIPVRIDGVVEGAVLVSQSTSRILQALYAVRLDVFRVFLVSLAAAVVLTLLVATTIARPLSRLRQRAEAILDRRGRLRGSFEPSRRNDEIGDLERALAELTRRLEEHLRFTESFAADVAHELKNPLAAIRSATEMAIEMDDPAERHRFLTMVQHDVARMERLISEAREISRIDARIDEEELERVALDQLLRGVVEAFRLRRGDRGPRFELELDDRSVEVLASADRITQVVENLLANAVSFSPADGEVTVALRVEDDNAVATISDDGPGFPDEHLERVFTRFFSYRPNHPADGHSGLGLSIAKAVVEAYHGTVAAENHPDGGAVMTVRLPLAP